MKTQIIAKIFFSLMLSVVILISCNENQTERQKNEVTEKQNHDNMMDHSKMQPDNRISLNVSPQKAQHQLMNMRNHLAAIQSIIDYLSKEEYDKASEVASSKLGLSQEMKMMCSSFGNKDFEKLGLEFHNNADKMSEIFMTKDKNKSLEALSVTINSCVKCHSTFKQ